MLLHPAILGLVPAIKLTIQIPVPKIPWLTNEAVPSTVRESRDAVSFTTVDGKYVSLVYGHDMLGQYQKACSAKVLDIDGSKMRTHTVQPGAFHLDGKDHKRFYVYLASIKPDIITAGEVFAVNGQSVFNDLLNGMLGDKTTAALQQQLPSLTFAKREDGSYHLDHILRQYNDIFKHPMAEHFTHVYYGRGTRSWAIFIDYEGAKYALFF